MYSYEKYQTNFIKIMKNLELISLNKQFINSKETYAIFQIYGNQLYKPALEKAAYTIFTYETYTNTENKVINAILEFREDALDNAWILAGYFDTNNRKVSFLISNGAMVSYNPKEDKESLTEKALKETFVNIASYACDITLAPNILNMTTWEIGKQLIDIAAAECNFDRSIFPINCCKCYQSNQEHEKIMPMLSHIILDSRYNEEIKELASHLLQYWDDTFSPPIQDYWDRYDQTDYCTNSELLLG